MSRLALALLLIPNIGATVLALYHQRWPAALLYCGGNGLWIAVRSRQGTRHDSAAETIASVVGPCLVMTAGALSWARLSESVGLLNDGFAWDGQHYAALYSYFSSGEFMPVTPRFPWSQRIGLPFLAAQLPVPARESFMLLHAIFWCATMALFSICCRRYFGLRTRSIQLGVLWLQILWLSIPRGTATYGFMIDSAALFFMQAWVFLVVSRRWRWLLPPCAFVGVLFKETVGLLVALSCVALVALWVVPRFRRAIPPEFSTSRMSMLAPLALAVLAAAIGKWIASHALPPGDQIRGSELDTMLTWLSLRWHRPMQMVRYLAATFSAYGGFALVRVATLDTTAAAERPWGLAFATALCPLYFAVCFLAGSDLTRFAFMAFPFALPVLLVAVDEVPLSFALLGLLLGLPAAHLFTPIPDPLPGHDRPNQDLRGLYSWMMEYAHPALVGLWTAWWLACILLLRSARMAVRFRKKEADPDSTGAT